VLDFASRSISGDCQRLGKKLKKTAGNTLVFNIKLLDQGMPSEVAMIHPS